MSDTPKRELSFGEKAVGNICWASCPGLNVLKFHPGLLFQVSFIGDDVSVCLVGQYILLGLVLG